MPRFIHAADIHLDSPMRGLPSYPGAPTEEVRGATRRALEALVDLAIEEAVDLLVIAGDLYDGDWRDYNTGLFLAAEMTRLREAGIRVVIASGNHDAASQITKHLKLPDNVTRLSTRHPESLRLDDLGLVVHGQGFAERHVAENVTQAYPAPLPDLFNLGVLHTSAGLTGHDEYAPCSRADLLDRGYQYWALGHIHRREVLAEAPWVLFPGNLQGRHIRETGPKGCSLVEVSGEQARVEHRALAVVQWELCGVDGSTCHDGYELLERLRVELERLLDECAAPTLATRVAVRGQSPAAAQLLAEGERWLAEARAAALDVGGGRIWLERLEVEPAAAALPGTEDSPAGAGALEVLERAELDAEGLAELLQAPALQDLLAKLPRELREPLEEATGLEELVPRARALLLARVAAGGEQP